MVFFSPVLSTQGYWHCSGMWGGLGRARRRLYVLVVKAARFSQASASRLCGGTTVAHQTGSLLETCRPALEWEDRQEWIRACY
ncbi:hypothetical protein QQF64_003882 [Cirrhinus molitorella]|uniref:Secreted protein n=1 Tax=Cirrhinus molitorella TaxID=172907 RepID=A0ABR3MMM5_9TELE